MLVAGVLLNGLSLNRPFDYLIPQELAHSIRVGTLVDIPFGKGNSLRTACVISVSPYAGGNRQLKSIIRITPNRPSLPEALLKLADWMSAYYCCPREKALQSLIPGAVRSGKIRPKTEARYYVEDMNKYAQYAQNATKRQLARVAVLQEIVHRPGMTAKQIQGATNTSASVLAALLKEGLVIREDEEVKRDPFKGIKVEKTEPRKPTEEQQIALEKIFQMTDNPTDKHVLLLHGVTCSGKTEVYLQAIAHVLEKGGSAIVLVPEISLTPQTVTRFRSRFGDMVSVLHSGLSDGERFDEWMKVRLGTVRIAIGARSALFAPFDNLKLIIVDEEHEPSYKQSEAPRYNARDVAVMRGKMENAVVILGSATPSLESFQNAKTGKYELVRMMHRSDPNLVMPRMSIIDMKLEMSEENKSPIFSKTLKNAIHDRLQKAEQTILFLNKRGFARQMMCDACGYVAQCPNCSVSYTYHKSSETLFCHLCASAIPAPEVCPQCGNTDIRYSGMGTEKIEEIVRKLFPHATVARMDSDTMTRPKYYDMTLSAFKRGETDILIGTQMIAKGLDFPNVTLVGIINPDLTLSMSDFRSEERAFQLIEQVAGRAGRGHSPGEVIVQTRVPYNPSIQYAADHNYDAFFEDEIMVREEFDYPPFTHLAVLHFDGLATEEIVDAAGEIINRIQEICTKDGVSVNDVVPAPLERLNGKFRYMAVVKGKKLSGVRNILRSMLPEWQKRHKDVSFYADFDPLSIM